MGYTSAQINKMCGTTSKNLSDWEDYGLIKINRIDKIKDFTADDVERIKTIKLYRSFDVTLSRIKQILNSDKDKEIAILEESLDESVKNLEKLKCSITNLKEYIYANRFYAENENILLKSTHLNALADKSFEILKEKADKTDNNN